MMLTRNRRRPDLPVLEPLEPRLLLAATLPHMESFNDGVADEFLPQSGTWTVNGALRYRGEAAAVSLLDLDRPLPADTLVGAVLRNKDGGASLVKNAFLIFDHQNANDFKFAGAFIGANEWRVGHFDGSNWITDASTSETLDVEINYDAELRLDGTVATLRVGGVVKARLDFTGDALNDGRIGLGTRNALAVFDDFFALEVVPGEIRGIKWNDLDGDGQFEPADGEVPLADWTLFLDEDGDGALDPNETSTTTDANGAYTFPNVIPGTHTVAEVVPDGWEQTFPGPVLDPAGTRRVATGLSRPLYATAPPGDTDRLFIVEQHPGRIRILNLETGTINATPFLDIDGLATGNEQGLLGLAFDPDYGSNGFFYVNFNIADGATHIRRYQVSASDPDVADPGSAATILTYAQPFANHNGGWLGFGPDGLLYIASGDGGSGGDPGNRAQDTTNQLLGKILRIDPSGDDFPGDPNLNYAIPPTNPFVGQGGDDEIWAYGLRNPWRPSFDRVTDDFFIADVGQSSREEVNFQPASSSGGENYGWRVMESDLCFDGSQTGGNPPCFDSSLTDPIHVYGHTGAPNGGFSITGGYVYRGPIAELKGVYFFADFVTQQIWSFRYDGPNLTEFTNRTAQFVPDIGTIDQISSFGEDAVGNLYITDLGGEVFQVVQSRRPGSRLVQVDPDVPAQTIDFGNRRLLDFGDAPDDAVTPRYPTLLSHDGARHATDAGGPLLGVNRDTEPDGQPHAAALGDDKDGFDDEDAVVLLTAVRAGQAADVEVTASAAGLLDAWVDFNGDGDWDDPGEQIFTGEPLSAGPNSLNFTPPTTSALGETFARFRLSTAGGLAPTGPAPDGEVEDRRLEIEPAATLPHVDDFSNGVADFFVPQSGIWFVNPWNRYRAEAVAGTDAISLIPFADPLPADLVVDVMIRGKEGGSGFFKNAVAIYDYHGPGDFKFAGGFMGANQWRVGHVEGTTWVVDEVFSRKIDINTDYGITVRITGTLVTLLVDGISISHDYGADPLNDGEVGLGAHNAFAVFDDLSVEELAPPVGVLLPHSDDFDNGVADGFATRSGAWFVNTPLRYRAQPTAGNDAVSLLQLAEALPAEVWAEVTIRGKDGGSGFLKNAMFIFDYQGPSNFKFAGGFFGINRWRIGHFNGSSWVTDTFLGETIATDIEYALALHIEGGTVSLSVDGVSKVGHDYGTDPLNDGDIALGAHNAVAVFDELSIGAPLTGLHLVHISVDGLRPDAVTALGPGGAPNFYRLRTEGAFTDNARADFAFTNTLPNHTSMVTGRGVSGLDGHGWTINSTSALTIHQNKGSYVAGAFDVVHDHGLSTAIYASKSKFDLYDRSYDAVNGAADATGADDGRDKVDTYVFDSNTATLLGDYVTAMSGTPFDYSMVHLRDPDTMGHTFDWDLAPGSTYLDSIATVDGLLGQIFSLIETHPELADNTVIILTADHGGTEGTFTHAPATLATNYTIPFYVWGPGVDAGADLYALNTGRRLDPATGRPPYTDPVQPIRNGDVANLVLDLLSLPAVPGSTINPARDLLVSQSPSSAVIRRTSASKDDFADSLISRLGTSWVNGAGRNRGGRAFSAGNVVLLTARTNHDSADFFGDTASPDDGGGGLFERVLTGEVYRPMDFTLPAADSAR